MYLCVPITYNIDYFGCDCKACYSMCVKGFTFWNVIVRRLRINMEIPST